MPSQELSPIYSDYSTDADMLELVQEFVECLQDRVNDIENAVEADNLSDLTRLAHQLKGAGGGYGFGVISQAAAQLEAASKAAQSTNQIREQVDELTSLCRRASAEAPA